MLRIIQPFGLVLWEPTFPCSEWHSVTFIISLLGFEATISSVPYVILALSLKRGIYSRQHILQSYLRLLVLPPPHSCLLSDVSRCSYLLGVFCSFAFCHLWTGPSWLLPHHTRLRLSRLALSPFCLLVLALCRVSVLPANIPPWVWCRAWHVAFWLLVWFVSCVVFLLYCVVLCCAVQPLRFEPDCQAADSL